MRRAAVAGAVWVLLSGRGLAADLPLKAAALSAFDWSGFYVGVGGGFQSGTVTGSAVAGLNVEPTFWGFGLSGGYRYQLPDNLVLGLDISVPVWASQTTFTAPVGTLALHPLFALTPEVQLGYSIGRLIPFAGFGVGFTDTKATATPVGGTAAWTTQLSPLFIATFGINYAVTDHLIVGLRYDHFEVEEGNWVFANAVPPVTGQAGGNSNGVTATLQYKF